MSDLPRLLLCCFDVVPAPTAVSRRLTEYLKGLSTRFQVVVLSVKTPDHPHIERYQGARLLRVPVGSGDFLARVQAFDRAVRRQLESEEYLVVHFFDPFGGYTLAERRAELGYKLVYDLSSVSSFDLSDEGDAESTRRVVAKARRQELFCLMNADAVIVGNPLSRDWALAQGVDGAKVHVVRAPVDLSAYAESVMGSPDATTMRVVHLGSLAARHDLSTMIEAMARVVNGEGGPAHEFRFTTVGPTTPEAKARLEAQAAALGLAHLVECQPSVPHDDLHKVLAASDVGLLSLSRTDRNRVAGSSLSRLGEYLAAGRPVLAADVPSARQVAPEGAVRWYEAGDVNSLADALRQLAGDPALRVTLGQAARSASNVCDASIIRADVVALYSDVTGQAVQRQPEDELASDPNEPTQLGKSLLAADAGEVTQLGARPFADSVPTPVGGRPVEGPSSSNKAPTDPAIDADQSLRPAVMGVPLHEEVPVVAGYVLEESVVVAADEAPSAPATGHIAPLELPEWARPAPVVLPVAPGRSLGPPKTPGPIAPLEVPQWPADVVPRPSGPSRPRASASPAATPAGPQQLTVAEQARLEPPPLPPLGAKSSKGPAPDDERSSPVRSSVSSRDTQATGSDSQASRSTVSSGGVQRADGSVPLRPEQHAVADVSAVRASGVSGVTRVTQAEVAPANADESRATNSASSGSAPDLMGASFDLKGARGQVPAEGHRASRPVEATSGLTRSARESSILRDAPQPTPTAPAPLRGALPSTDSRGLKATEGPASVVPTSAESGVKRVSSSSGVVSRPVEAEGALKPMVTSSGSRPPALPPPLPSAGRSSSPSGLSIAPLVLPPISAPTHVEREKSPAPSVSEAEEVFEIADHEVESVDELVGTTEPRQEDEVISSDDAIQAVDTGPSLPPSAIDPWLAQLVHGYCPPGSHIFDRHVPPTTMPGRDQ